MPKVTTPAKGAKFLEDRLAANWASAMNRLDTLIAEGATCSNDLDYRIDHACAEVAASALQMFGYNYEKIEAIKSNATGGK